MDSEQPPGPQRPYVGRPPDGPYQQPPGDSGHRRDWQPPTDMPYQQQPLPDRTYQQAPGTPYQRPPPGLAYQQQQPPPPPRQKRHRGLKITAGIVGGIVLLIIVAAALGGSKSGTGTSASTGTSTGNSSGQAAQSATSTALPGIGDKVRDGKFQFVITKVTHAKSVGDTQFGLGDTAQGKYTILHITVTNIGNQAQTLDDSSQYAYDAAGRKFDASSSADIDMAGANGQNSTWLDDINPGNTVHGRIALDLPAGDKAVKAELHDSMFSGGVTVSLR